jgi:hypothetical protein
MTEKPDVNHAPLEGLGSLLRKLNNKLRRAPLPEPDLLTPRETAAILHFSIKTHTGHVASGDLRYVLVGQGKKRPRRMFTRPDIARRRARTR